MDCFIKLIDKETIAYPVEIAADKKSAIKLWGKSGYVACNIGKKTDPNTFADKLVDGKVVISEQRDNEAKAFNEELAEKRRSIAKTFRRTQAIEKSKIEIKSENFDINKLSSFELKVMFGIDGGPTDEELGIK